MPNYAIIENGKVINTVVAEADYAAQQGWILFPEDMGIGCLFDGENWTNPNPVVIPEPTPPAAPTKEELLAQLQALQAQIQALE